MYKPGMRVVIINNLIDNRNQYHSLRLGSIAKINRICGNYCDLTGENDEGYTTGQSVYTKDFRPFNMSTNQLAKVLLESDY
jgi:hypothetical protein